jgi:outer membrane protein assembly factor BamB
VVVKEAQLVNLGRPWAHLLAGSGDVLQILPARGVATVGRRDERQRSSDAGVAHLGEGVLQKRVPVAVTPVEGHRKAGLFPTEGGQQLAAAGGERADASCRVVVLGNRLEACLGDVPARGDPAEEGHHVFGLFRPPEADEQEGVVVGVIHGREHSGSWLRRRPVGHNEPMVRPGSLLVAPALAAVLAALPPTVAGSPPAGAAPVRTCGPTSGEGQAPWPEFGGDDAHSQAGAGVTKPAGTLRRKWETIPLDGALYAEALVAGACVYVATENDSVYAFSESSGAQVWHVHLASPVTGGLACDGDISPSGITGTPVLDPARGELWAAVLTDVSGRPEHEIVALNARTGRLLRRQELGLPGTDPAAEQQRAALDVERGHVYVALGGLYGDCGNYKGAVISVPESGGRALGYWHTPTAREGAVWEVGGPDVLPDGDLLLATGNSAASPGQAYDGGDSVVELTADLELAGYFAPAAWAQWNTEDLDLGSTGPALLPGGLAFQVGKAGEGFLVSPARLAGIGGELASAQVCNGGAYGADAVAGSTVYVPCTGGVVAVHAAGRSLRVLWSSSAGGTGSPVVAGGRVFEEAQGGQLVALSPATGKVLQSISLASPATHFPWLVAVGSSLYAPDGTRLAALSGL